MSVHFSNLYGIFKNSSYHVSKEKTSAQRQKRKKPLLGRPIFTLNLYSLVDEINQAPVVRNQSTRLDKLLKTQEQELHKIQKAIGKCNGSRFGLANRCI